MVSAWIALATAGTVASVGIEVPTVAAAPVVDCVLDDEAWSHAASLGDFRQTHPGDNTPTSRTTEVLLVRTARALYVGVRAADEPARVRATLARRDAIGDDDSISLYLDTFHDRRRSYVLMVNPLGIQQDGLFVEGREPDFSVDLQLRSRGCLGPRGYTVELRIPFESLRYHAGAGRTWGLHVLRQIKHLDEEDSWMPLRRARVGVGQGTREVRARFLDQAGTLGGLEGLEHTPVLGWIPVESVARSEGERGRASLGGTARLSLTPALALDLAANPDFAEIEADQPQSTANVRFPLFYDEKRPFFLEDADLYRTPVRAFHSRSLVDPDLAVKLTGTRGRSSASALFALDSAPGHFSAEERAEPQLAREIAPLLDRRALAGVLRVRRDVGAQSSLGLLATGWRFADRHNEVAGLDGRLALGSKTIWTFQFLRSLSRLAFRDLDSGQDRLRDGAGWAYSSEWARSGERLSLQLAAEGYSADYRSVLGYTQRTDAHRWSLLTRYNAAPRHGGALVSWSLVNTTLAQCDGRGRMQYAYTYPQLLLTFKRQTFLNLSAYQDYARLFEEEFGPRRGPGQAGAFAGPSAERSSFYNGLTVVAGSAPSQKLSFSVTFDRSWNNLDLDQGAGRFGRVSPGALLDPLAPFDPGPGRYRYLGASLALQPTEALRLTASYEHGRLTRYDSGLDAFDQHLVSLRVQHAFSRFSSARLRLDYDSLDRRLYQQLVLSFTPRPGTGVYLGYDERGSWSEQDAARLAYRRKGRTFFAKLSWSQRTRLGGASEAGPSR